MDEARKAGWPETDYDPVEIERARKENEENNRIISEFSRRTAGMVRRLDRFIECGFEDEENARELGVLFDAGLTYLRSENAKKHEKETT